MATEHENLKILTNDELAKVQGTTVKGKLIDVLCQYEWKRRTLKEQHELNIEILQKQHEFNEKLFKRQANLSKKLALFAFLGVLLGAFITAIATLGTIHIQEVLKNKTTQSISESPTTVHRKETKESLAQAVAVLTNASTPNPTLNQTANTSSE